MVKSGLGKGFGSLLPDNFDKSILLDKEERVQKVLIQDIKPDPKQPRKTFDQTAIDELAQSIKQYGILQPLVIAEVDEGYVIVAGERRYRAAQKAGLSHVPALVRTIEELERLEIALVENVQRVDLSPLEQALSIARLNEQFSMSHQDIAKRLGKAHTTIVNTVRLLQLPDFAKQELMEGRISEGHARAVLALKGSPSAQHQLVQNIIENGWSVRRAEAFVLEQKGAKSPKEVSNAKPSKQESKLAEKFGAAVKVKESKKGGSVTFKFDSHKKFVQFLENL
jgi:ParB family transcriptional regulator, chromosome partitioning protein